MLLFKEQCNACWYRELRLLSRNPVVSRPCDDHRNACQAAVWKRQSPSDPSTCFTPGVMLESYEPDTIRIDRLRALSWFCGWWCMAVLSWYVKTFLSILYTKIYTIQARWQWHSCPPAHLRLTMLAWWVSTRKCAILKHLLLWHKWDTSRFLGMVAWQNGRLVHQKLLTFIAIWAWRGIEHVMCSFLQYHHLNAARASDVLLLL